MATSASQPVLVDTSTAVAFLLADHAHHPTTFDALSPRRLGLAGHAAFETFSVLTRLPSPVRRTPAAVRRLLRSNFPHSRFLGIRQATTLLESLPEHGIAGGAVYDALVGATAAEHGLRLVSRDRRAVHVYRALDVDVEVLG